MEKYRGFMATKSVTTGVVARDVIFRQITIFLSVKIHVSNVEALCLVSEVLFCKETEYWGYTIIVAREIRGRRYVCLRFLA